MRAAVEISGFLALALGAHLLVWQGATTAVGSGAGPSGGGAVVLNGASATLQQMVAAWDSRPDLDVTAPAFAPPPAPDPPPALTATRRDIPVVVPQILPMPGADRPATADRPPPPPPPRPKPKPKPDPRPKAEVTKPAPDRPEAPNGRQPAAGAPAAERLSGTGPQGAQAAGKTGAGQPAATTSDPGQIARWGGAIRSSIERRKRYPAGSRASGSVALAISVSSSGALAGLSVVRSSGDAAMDRAAVDAVQRARLPKAPGGIAAGNYSFTLAIEFSG